jgi:hypothetical protein
MERGVTADKTRGNEHADFLSEARRSLLDELHAMGVRFRKWLDAPVTWDATVDLAGTSTGQPSSEALERLKQFAAAAKANCDIQANSPAFRQMLADLPFGRHLPEWAKQDLWFIFLHARRSDDGKLVDRIFELRFGFELDDSWTERKLYRDIGTLWRALEGLPDAHVEENEHLGAVIIDDHAESAGWYGSKTVALGPDTVSGTRAAFEDVVQHEVGHAVHKMKKTAVDDWLRTRFGWKRFPATVEGFEQWVQLMGGWGDLDEVHRLEMRGALLAAIGTGRNEGPNSSPLFPREHPWHARGFGLRIAFLTSRERWYRYFAWWHRANGHAFFMNYWEPSFIAVPGTTLDIVASMPRSYAAASPNEFFAELYELYYDLDDPARRFIPRDVTEWLDREIGVPDKDAVRWQEMRKQQEKKPAAFPGRKKKKSPKAKGRR